MDNSKAKVNVLFFAKSRELAGITGTSLLLPKEIVCLDLLNFLCQQFNFDIIKESIILAINEDYCENKNALLQLKDGDEIAVIPPISGG